MSIKTPMEIDQSIRDAARLMNSRRKKRAGGKKGTICICECGARLATVRKYRAHVREVHKTDYRKYPPPRKFKPKSDRVRTG